MNTLVWNVVIACMVSVLCIQLMRPIAIRIGLVDIPGGRKAHRGHIPLIGGLAMFFGFCFASLTLDISLQPYRSLFAGAFLLVFMGVADDFHELSARMRLVAQLLVSLLMVFWGKIYLSQFGDFFVVHTIHLGVFGIVLTIIVTIGLINAKNMLDGMNGLAGGLSFIELAFLGYLAWHAGRVNDAKIIFVLMGAIFGFLLFNFPFKNHKKLVFMGDAGSMLLGFVLTWFCISLSQYNPNPASNPVTFVWVIIIPLFDMVGVFILRLLSRRSPLLPDRLHLHYQLKDKGLSNLSVDFFIFFVAIVGGIIGIAMSEMSVVGRYAIIPFLVLFIAYLIWLKKTETKKTRKK